MELVILYIILISVFFTIGYILFILSKKTSNNENYKVEKTTTENLDYNVLEALEHSKQSQIDYLSSKINDIYTKLEIIESQLTYSSHSKNIGMKGDNNDEKDLFNHNKSHNITLLSSEENKYHSQVNTVPFILNLLSEPKTSREIKNAIGKSREHTARLMKKLYEMNYVERDTSNKPFKYKLTVSGKNYLSQRNEDTENFSL
ncbi:MAG: hypothetical protein ACE5SW_05850 [Nitrososphaeraceae archaeon]